jgi:hypothetical protein
MGKLKSEIQTEVERLKQSRAGTTPALDGAATHASLDESGKWQGHNGELTDDDREALDSVKHAVFQPVLESLDSFLQAPVPPRPETGEEFDSFRSFAKRTREAAAQRERIRKALAPADANNEGTT